VDGRTFRSVTRPNRAGRFAVHLYPRKLKRGRHTLSARVSFGRAPDTPQKQVRDHFRTCARG
jgi:hypothetical protein